MFASPETEQTTHFDGTHSMSLQKGKKVPLNFYFKRDTDKYKLLSPLFTTGQCLSLAEVGITKT